MCYYHLSRFIFYFMYTSVLLACIYVHRVCAWCPMSQNRVLHSELELQEIVTQHVVVGLNLTESSEQQVFLTTEPPVQVPVVVPVIIGLVGGSV